MLAFDIEYARLRRGAAGDKLVALVETVVGGDLVVAAVGSARGVVGRGG